MIDDQNMSHTSSIDIDFQNLTYNVGRRGRREILHSIHGSFCSGNLIGILGPSGAGKTTLLNILAGKINKGVNGVIMTNGTVRDMRAFHKMSSYIMQEDIVQEQLTVLELMSVAANLKLGPKVNESKKQLVIKNVVNLIGLSSTLDTRTEKLSGGQRKRLAIALELINNPPVMFLDEPTTGLDNVVSKQCIQLLKQLAHQGRTIVCTIHQPSDLLFYLFDQVYFMSEGYCVYNGSVNSIVPFLKQLNTPCPTTSSPADYVVELINNNEENTRLLAIASGNGQVNNCNAELGEKIISTKQKKVYNPTTHPIENYDTFTNFPTPFLAQVGIILRRMFMQMGRNKMVLGIQVLHHIVSAVCVGISFFAVGNNASQAMANFKLLIGMILFYAYTHIMSPILLFPFELELIRREYFNRWYGLKAYYTALTISSMPLTIILGVVFNGIVYVLTGQPLEITRFMYFNIFTILIALNSYGLGIAIGSTVNVTKGAVIGSGLGVCLLLICMYGMGYENAIEPFMQVVMFLDFMRHGLVGLGCSLLRKRPLMDCDDEIYCHFRDPEILLKLMGMGGSNIHHALWTLVGFLIFHRLAAYVALKRRVTPDSLLVRRCF